jgi:hypoxanthine phosphoribosyltransferase
MDGILKKALHENMKVLIVEDIVDSGATVGELQSYASKIASKKYWSSYMKFASLWQNTSCNVQADYWINSIDREVDQRWVVMPWEA